MAQDLSTGNRLAFGDAGGADIIERWARAGFDE
jgi:hypothetical protein